MLFLRSYPTEHQANLNLKPRWSCKVPHRPCTPIAANIGRLGLDDLWKHQYSDGRREPTTFGCSLSPQPANTTSMVMLHRH